MLQTLCSSREDLSGKEVLQKPLERCSDCFETLPGALFLNWTQHTVQLLRPSLEQVEMGMFCNESPEDPKNLHQEWLALVGSPYFHRPSTLDPHVGVVTQERFFNDDLSLLKHFVLLQQ